MIGYMGIEIRQMNIHVTIVDETGNSIQNEPDTDLKHSEFFKQLKLDLLRECKNEFRLFLERERER